MSLFRGLYVFQLKGEVEGDVCLSFTGHSLGAFLSNAMAMAFDSYMPAFLFSGPGVMWSLKNTLSKNELFIYRLLGSF